MSIKQRRVPLPILVDREFSEFKAINTTARLTPMTATTPSVAVYGRDHYKLAIPTPLVGFFESPRTPGFVSSSNNGRKRSRLDSRTSTSASSHNVPPPTKIGKVIHINPNFFDDQKEREAKKALFEINGVWYSFCIDKGLDCPVKVGSFGGGETTSPQKVVLGENELLLPSMPQTPSRSRNDPQGVSQSAVIQKSSEDDTKSPISSFPEEIDENNSAYHAVRRPAPDPVETVDPNDILSPRSKSPTPMLESEEQISFGTPFAVGVSEDHDYDHNLIAESHLPLGMRRGEIHPIITRVSSPGETSPPENSPARSRVHYAYSSDAEDAEDGDSESETPGQQKSRDDDDEMDFSDENNGDNDDNSDEDDDEEGPDFSDHTRDHESPGASEFPEGQRSPQLVSLKLKAQYRSRDGKATGFDGILEGIGDGIIEERLKAFAKVLRSGTPYDMVPKAMFTADDIDELDRQPYRSIVPRLKSDMRLWEACCAPKKGACLCGHCGGKFSNLVEFSRHLDEFQIRRHYTCPLMESCVWSVIGFSKRSEWVRHIRNQHGPKGATFRCHYPDCQRGFIRKDTLKRHMMLLHDQRVSNVHELLNPKEAKKNSKQKESTKEKSTKKRSKGSTASDNGVTKKKFKPAAAGPLKVVFLGKDGK